MHSSPALTAAIDRFVAVAFQSRDSIFTPGKAIWTPETLDDLHRRFVQNPDESNATFTEKFRRQLDGAPADTCQLAAELVYVQLLTPFNMGAKAKSTLVDTVRSWSSVQIPFPDDLRRAFDRGLVTDQSFMQARPNHLWYLIEVLRKWNALAMDERVRLLADPWAFKTFGVGVEVKACQPMREILYFFVHPAYFEDITSRKHKQLLCDKFRSRVASPASDVDQLLHQIRDVLSKEYGVGFNYYSTSIQPLWRGETDGEPDADPWSQFMSWARRFRETASFEKAEIDYKKQIAARINDAKLALFANDSSFTEKLRKAFGPPNNLTAWQTHDRFLRWCNDHPEESAAALKTLWSEGDVRDRMHRFLEAIPSAAGKGAGLRATIASFLLMGLNPVDNPMYRKMAFVAAYRLSGHPTLPPNATPVEQYTYASAFLDKMVEASKSDAVPMANRLEAQGAVWAITKSSARPADWTDQEWRELEQFRSGAKDETDGEDDSTDDGDDVGSSSLGRLADTLLLDAAFLEDARQLLEDKRQVVFYGPPGTGKTYVAQKLAETLTGSPGRVRLVQFHPSYAYEDFIEGFRPALVNGSPGFRLSEGPLKALAREAVAEPGKRFVLLIDELNRGNLAKVFGELYFLLEYRGLAMKLQYSEADFALPENLWIIGTMNSADRTIALLDAALRRRFYFMDFFPDRWPIEGLLRRWLERNKPEMIWVADVVDLVNRELRDRQLAIGPSHFMKKNLDAAWVEKIWRHAILPYLDEHFFGEPDRVRDFDLTRLRLRLQIAP
jgi:MoxR-like ATPase